jgi:hypothetical protein
MSKKKKAKKKVIKRTIRRTIITEELLFIRRVKWVGKVNDFVELAYALYETGAVECIGPKQSKEIYIHNLANFFGISNIHNHKTLHSHKLGKPIEEHFPYKMEKNYENYQENLIEKESSLDKKKKSHKEYFSEEDEAEESDKTVTVAAVDVNDPVQEALDIEQEEIEYVDIIIEEIPL